ncbi:serine/threonine protein kinase [Minicystis rosea]|nr:serine/threonine protein kinase [Minicystis rosea]
MGACRGAVERATSAHREVYHRDVGSIAPQPIAEGATVAASPAGLRRLEALPARAQVTRALTMGTTAEVLRADEQARVLAFSRALVSLSGLGVLALPFFHSTRPTYWPMVITVITLFGASAWMWWHARREGGDRRSAFRVFVGVAALAGFIIEYDLGFFSPAPLFVSLAISIMAQSSDRRFAHVVPIISATLYFVAAALVMLGVLPDLGLFAITAGPPNARVLMLVLVPASFLIAYWQARQNRRATVNAIERSHEALRLALTREAQLAEAHQNLDQALRAGAGTSGRYTGIVMGRYRLEEVVGRGAMGEVYAATHVETGERAAVKVLQASLSHDPDLKERFFREGRIASRLAAPNIVKVLDVGDDGAGVPYIAMELLSGRDLAAHLRQSPRLDPEVVAELLREVGRGLAAAHGAGVVHRDLKPQNIFGAEEDGERRVWKILDFGVSKLRDASATLTHAAVVGTPGYMSPEQARGGDIDPRSDLFALGAVAYRALTGRPPFSGEMPQVLFEIAYKSPIRPSELVPSLPSDIDSVLAIALAKEPNDRFESTLALADAFADASRGELDPALSARAAALIAARPWGTALREALQAA